MRQSLAQRIFIHGAAAGLAAGAALIPAAAPGHAAPRAAAPAERAVEAPEIDAGFHLLYELKFVEARAQFTAWQKSHPDDPLGYAAEAAGYLFEEFYRHGVLTSEFFLDDKRLLGGIVGKPDAALGAAFSAADQRALQLARQRLKSSPQ